MVSSPRSTSTSVRWVGDRGGVGRLLSLGAAVLLLAVLVPPAEAQQTGTITGQVVDGSNMRPLAGAQVTAVDTGIGTLTRSEGRFTLQEVPAGEVTLRVQMLGYRQLEETVSVQAGATAEVTLQMDVSALALEELIVTGVGQATARRELATSVSSIGLDQIEAAPVQTLDQLLQGRVAGAQVSNVSAQPGTASQMNFRGVSSAFGSQTPVIYVDGVRVDNSHSVPGGGAYTGEEGTSALAEILTSDIERIEITRGGAASTLYGSDAATGVIQIFTRRGQPGAPRITARVEQGVDTPELKYMLDAELIYPSMVERGDVPGDFLAREFFQSGHAQAYNVNVSGGTEATTYSISGRIEQADGVQPKNDHEVFNLRGRVETEVAQGMRAHFSGGYTRSNFSRIFSGTAINDPLTAMEVGDAMFFSGQDNLFDALEVFLMPDITESVNRFQFSTGLDFQHSPRFSARATVGLDHRNNHNRLFQPIGFIPGNDEGSLNRRQRDFTSVTLETSGTFAYPRDGDFTSRLTVGVQGFRENTSIVNAQGVGFALPGSKDFGEAADISAFEDNQQVFTGGLFIDEQIGLWQRLFVNVGLRVDGGTSFGDDVDFEVYPKAGVAYALGQEQFFRDLFGNWASEFQLRAAYGETGKFPPPFLRDRTFDAMSFRGESAPRFDNPGNPDLRPEVTSTFELGFETAMLNDRIGIDFTWYDARTQDALFFVPEQPATGQGTQIRNVGEIHNTGIEVDLNVLLVNRRNLALDVGATFQTVDNEVVDMGGAAPFFVETQKRVEEGHPVGAWFLTTPFDSNGDGNLDSFESRFSGKSPLPDRSGSISTRITLYERLHLSAMGDWATGHEVFDWGSVWATFNGIFRRELVDPDFQFPVEHDLDGNEIGPYSQSAARSAFLMDGDFFKLREISARYILPDRWIAGLGVDRGTIYGSVRNVAIRSTNPLVDPELAGVQSGGLSLGGETSTTMSPPRSFRFGVEFTF